MNELQLPGAGDGKTLAARIRKRSNLNQVLNTTSGAFEAWDDDNIALYRIAMTPVGGGAYQATMPTLAEAVPLTADAYTVEYEDTVDGSFDAPNGSEAIIWNGTAVLNLASIPGAILADPANKLTTNASGQVSLNLTQPLNEALNTATVGGSFMAGWCGWFGKKILDTVALKLRFFASNNTTIVKELTVDSTTAPTSVTTV